MNVCVIVVPYDSGIYGARMGCGPERLLEAALRPLLRRLGHTMLVDRIRASSRFATEISTTFDLCSLVANRVHQCLQTGVFPLLLSGNCNIGIGAVAGCGCDTTGVAWFDAHGESHTPETTESGFLDGMGISTMTGQCWRRIAGGIQRFSPVPGDRVLLIGSRDVEPDECALLDRVGVRRISQIEDVGSAVESMSRKIDGVYIHLDLDVLDPAEATANQWTPAGGLTVETLKKAVREIMSGAKLKGFGIGSYDPECDGDLNALRAASAVAETILADGAPAW
jgi:arginase